MRIEDFKEALYRYGSQPENWPEHLRRQVELQVMVEPEFEWVLQEYDAMQMALAQVDDVPKPAKAAVERAIDAALAQPQLPAKPAALLPRVMALAASLLAVAVAIALMLTEQEKSMSPMATYDDQAVEQFVETLYAPLEEQQALMEVLGG